MENSHFNYTGPQPESEPRPGWQNPPQSPPMTGTPGTAAAGSQTQQAWQRDPSLDLAGSSRPPAAAPTVPPERGRRPARGRRLGIVAAVLASSLLSGLAGGFLALNIALSTDEESAATTEPTAALTQAPQSETPLPTTPALTGETMSVRQIAEAASPAVVAIYVEAVQDTFFGRQLIEGAGSGVIISADGYILTNQHVVANSRAAKVRLADGNEYDAEFIGSDEVADLAVLKIAEQNLPYLEFGDSSELHVGDQIVAIGNPLGDLQGTVTAGYVSALNRDVETESGTLYGVIQVDAAINSGNSGGALLNTRGELVGINVAKPIRTGVEGIAFSIPVSTAQPIATQLIETGTVKRPMIGINGSDVPANNPYDLTPGVLVREVQPGSPAEKAGLRVRDIITQINGQDVSSVADVNRMKNQAAAGDVLKLTVERGGELIEIELTLEVTDTD